MSDEAAAADESVADSTLYLADSSALVRAYFYDEPGHEELRGLLLESGRKVAASELALLEVTRAIAAASRAGRLDANLAKDLVEQVEEDLSADGVVLLIPLDGTPSLERAREIVLAHPAGSLDALHVAVAEREGRTLAGDDPLVFVTRDDTQASVARALGLRTA